MVAVLLRLRFRTLSNGLGRDTIQLAAVIGGGIVAAILLATALAAMLGASVLPITVTQGLIVVGGSALVLGWLVVPLLFDGVDRTIEPQRLAQFPLRAGTLMVAMFLVGVTWIPGVTTVAASVGTALAWWSHPVAAVAAVITGIVGAATCVVGARLTTGVAGALLRGRGAQRLGVIALVVLVGAALFAIIASSSEAARGADLLATFTSIIAVLGWTPLGAVWSVPGRLAMGDQLGAAAASTVAIGTLAVMVLAWRLTLGAHARVRGDRPVRGGAGDRLGALARMPATPTGAVAARSLIYWFRDARLARQLLLLPALPALMLLWWRLFDLDVIALATGPVVASVLPLSMFAGLSYDGTAFAAELDRGVRGVHDRLGRAVALLIIAAPATVIVQVAVAVLIGRAGDLPALLGLSIGTLLVAVGVVSVSSARLVVPVARAGRSPYSSHAGAATVSILASYAVAIVTIVLMVPAGVLAIVALAGAGPVLEWLALAAGVVLGSAVALGGVVVGGRALDTSGPEVLARLSLLRD